MPVTLTVHAPSTSLADLVAELRLPQASALSGQVLPVEITIANVGTAAAPATQARLLWSRDSVVDANDANLVDPSSLAVPALLMLMR